MDNNHSVNNIVIRKKIELKVKKDYIITPNNVVIRKKLKLKDSPPMLPMTPIIDSLPDDNYLDQKFLHHLMLIKDSWSEVKYKIRLDSNEQECWWDIEILLEHFAEQLNCSTMSNPSPQWPSNPFNRVQFEKRQLLQLGRQIKDTNLSVNCMIREFFNFLETKLRYVSIEKFSTCFVNYVSRNYRFRIINSKDSQCNYIGYWTQKDLPVSTFEMHYAECKKIFPCEYDEASDRTIERDEYRFYKEILDSIPSENVDLQKII
jgi:hypothetical protein